ncbi:MAG: glycosyltransferase family 39 protein [Tepidisphaeraceae bacterium]
MKGPDRKERAGSLQAAWPRPAAIIVLAAWGTGLAAVIWGKTGDIAGDFGHELYIAWQINAGRILFKDLSYPYGPLPACINAMWMRLFGLQLNSVLFGNALILLLATLLLHKLCLRCSGPLAAFLATAFFLPVFALSCPTRITTFNFLTPYAPGIVHGFVLCLGMIECLMRFHQSAARRWLILAGALTGLALLCKPEMFLGCAVTFAAGIAGSFWLRKPANWKKEVAIAVAAVAAPPLAAFALLSLAAGPGAALAAVFNGWQFAGKHYVLDTPFYRESFGTDDLALSLRLIFKTAAVDAGLIAALAALAFGFGKVRPGWIGLAAGLLAGGILFCVIPSDLNAYWIDADRGLVIWAVGAAAVAIWRLANRRGDATRTLAQACLLVLALTLLTKMFFNVRTYQYGFVLAAPCMISLILALVQWLPERIDRAGGCGRILRWGSVGLLAALAFNRLATTNRLLTERTLTVPLEFGGTLITRPQNQPILQAMAAIHALPTGLNLDVLPDGSGINYALGRVNPTPFDLADPLTLRLDGGEDRVLDALRHSPPDMVLLIHTDKSFVGKRWFGQDYALKIDAWVESNYHLAEEFGDPGQEKSTQLWLRN